MERTRKSKQHRMIRYIIKCNELNASDIWESFTFKKKIYLEMILAFGREILGKVIKRLK